MFPDASRVSAYIAVTRRRSDDETLLIGQSILTKHTIDGQRYEPYGYLGIRRENGLQLPLVKSDPHHGAFVQRCIEDFGLRLREEPGLSVIIPFPRTGSEDEENIGPSDLLAAIVRNYFYPIINGRLEITIEERDGSPPVTLTSDTIDRVVRNLELDDAGEWSSQSYTKLFQMCRESITLPESDHTHLAALPTDNPEDNGHAAVAGLRDSYNAGELLAFRIGGDAQRKKAGSQPTEFRLYLQKDDTLPQGQDYYVRGTLSISEMDNIRRHRSRALLTVSELNPLAAMLRDSEPAAHTSWRPQTRRVQERWVAPRRRIDAVRNAPAKLLSILEAPTEGLQRDAFADIFFWEEEANPVKPGSGISEGKRTSKVPVNPPPPSKREFVVSRIESGFEVTLAKGLEKPPALARLQVAYEIPRGNPLKSYHPEDFRLHGREANRREANLELHFGGCQLKPGQAGNEVFLQIDDPDEFEFKVMGFDRQRDVHVRVDSRVDPVEENAEVDDASP